MTTTIFGAALTNQLFQMPTIVSITSKISASILATFIFLLLIVILGYLLRDITLEEIFSATSTSVVYADRHSRNVAVVKIQNPFLFQLKNPELSSLGQLTCSITTQCPCIVQAFWGVDMQQLQMVLSFDWMSIRTQIENRGLLDQHGALRSGNIVSNYYARLLQNESMTFKPPSELLAIDIGPKPRKKYPLVVFIVRTDTRDVIPSTVVALIVTIHIKDELCDMESYILSHYLKQANGQCSNLQPLFVANTESDQSYNSDRHTNTQPLCVVCLTNVITHALLPCRHMCVCHRCFSLLDKCPLCRGFIQSFFCDSRSDDESQTTDSGGDCSPTVKRRNGTMAAPDNGTMASETGTEAPENGTMEPENGTMEPENETMEPENRTMEPECGAIAPENETVLPEIETIMPENLNAFVNENVRYRGLHSTKTD